MNSVSVSAQTLEEIAQTYHRCSEAMAGRIIVCAGTGCIANGAQKIFDLFSQLLHERGLNPHVGLSFEHETEPGIHLSGSGCQGFCQMGPLVTILPDNIMYTKVRAADVQEIIEETIVRKRVVERLLYKHPATHASCRGVDDIPFYAQQQRTVLKLCGRVDPGDIREYIAHGGYAAARTAYTTLAPNDICSMLERSGLRGRGGGGFPTGRKWRLAAQQQSPKKYVICNGDEGDPGAFMDRSVMEGNPHSVIEGILIAARGIGADEGYVYVRAEYPLAVQRMRAAVVAAESFGLLGDSVFGTQHKFRLNVMEGAGAFVCGEETALIASIEGRRGMPQPKPPFPAESAACSGNPPSSTTWKRSHRCRLSSTKALSHSG